jgi:hypothetical protein
MSFLVRRKGSMEKQQETERELHLDELQEVAGGDNQTGAIVGSTLGGAALVGDP